VTREYAQQLARGFAAHLRHLREFRGVRYIGAAALPGRPASVASPSSPDAPQVVPSRTTPLDLPVAPAAQRGDPAIPAEITQSPSTWSLEQAADPPRAPAPAVHLPVAAAADGGVRDQAKAWTAAEKLEYLRHKNLGNCQRCKLAKGRKHIVFGVGDPDADIMFIGEAPGFDEDRTGEPFIGAAGRRLTQWIELLGFKREQVYIANVLKCRPPGNRDPEPDEVEKCSPFLKAQIRAIRPKVIVALGRYAGTLMTGSKPDTMLRSMRGRSWPYRDAAGGLEASLFVTYHPSYVIRKDSELAPGQRNPADDTVMGDLRQAMLKLK
jgi:uracil-DNA glycosylase family 4